MRLHSPFASAPLRTLRETCLQNKLLVGVGESLHPLRSSEQSKTSGIARSVPSDPNLFQDGQRYANLQV